MRLAPLALALVLAAPARPAAAAARRVVLMPIGNTTRHPSATAEASRALIPLLARDGYEVIHPDRVEELLARLRVRYVDSLPAAVVDQVLGELDAEAVAFVTVLAYEESPAVAGMSFRLVGRGGITLGSAAASLAGDDTAGALDLGRIRDAKALLDRVAGAVVTALPADPRRRPAERAPRVLHFSSVKTYRAPALRSPDMRRVCLLPLQNESREKHAPRIVSELLSARLRDAGYKVVEAADFRTGLVAERIYSLAGLDPARLRALGKRLGTTLFVQGSVYQLDQERGGSPPAVEVYLWMTDVEKGRIMWTSYRLGRGDEYEGPLQLGGIHSAVSLADQVLAEMVEAMLRA